MGKYVVVKTSTTSLIIEAETEEEAKQYALNRPEEHLVKNGAIHSCKVVASPATDPADVVIGGETCMTVEFNDGRIRHIRGDLDAGFEFLKSAAKTIRMSPGNGITILKVVFHGKELSWNRNRLEVSFFDEDGNSIYVSER